MGNCQPIQPIGACGGVKKPSNNGHCGGEGWNAVVNGADPCGGGQGGGMKAVRDAGPYNPLLAGDGSQFKVEVQNGDGVNAPNYDYYLNPDQGQLRYDSMYNASEILARYGDMFSEKEAQAIENSARHKPIDKQQQFFGTLDYMLDNGIDRLSAEEFKAEVIKRGYNPNDPYQKTEIVAWATWSIRGGDVYM